VFAIGTVYNHLTQAEWQADDRDHLLYHARAWMLSLQDPWAFSNPDLAHMQITGELLELFILCMHSSPAGLLSFYYLSIGHINRLVPSYTSTCDRSY